MNSRWQRNRIGLIYFWYYDEEVFAFADGRMLLRGSNGSGKSVTMQSFIPLILPSIAAPTVFFFMKQYLDASLPMEIVDFFLF